MDGEFFFLNFATALAKLREAEVAKTSVTLDADEVAALIHGIKILNVDPRRA